jgi:hypothetical protein
MGLDFRISTAASYYVRYPSTNDEDDTLPWTKAPFREIGTLVEEAEYDPKLSEVRIVPAEPLKDATYPYETPRWSYSGFHRFRSQLASQLEINLEQMRGFVRSGDDESIRWEDLPDHLREHPLIPLFNHSDCEGDLSPEQCKAMWKALEDLVSITFDQDDYDRDAGLNLAYMMEHAALNERKLIFC